MGWNSKAHREMSKKCESGNLSREILSREVGRRSLRDVVVGVGAHDLAPEADLRPGPRQCKLLSGKTANGSLKQS